MVYCIEIQQLILNSEFSIDLKGMLKSHKGHKFILCIINEVTNYLITVPIYHSRSEEIGDALIENIISKYCIPEIHNYGSGQCIYVHAYELVVNKIEH